MSNLALYILMTFVLSVVAFALSRRYFRYTEQYRDEPTQGLKTTKDRVWKLANYLWMVSAAPLMVGVFCSQYSPLAVMKAYLPLVSIIIIIGGLLTIFFKNSKTLLPRLEQPDKGHAQKEFAWSALKGALWLIVVLTIFFMLRDNSYRKAVIKHYFSEEQNKNNNSHGHQD